MINPSSSRINPIHLICKNWTWSWIWVCQRNPKNSSFEFQTFERIEICALMSWSNWYIQNLKTAKFHSLIFPLKLPDSLDVTLNWGLMKPTLLPHQNVWSKALSFYFSEELPAVVTDFKNSHFYRSPNFPLFWSKSRTRVWSSPTFCPVSKFLFWWVAFSRGLRLQKFQLSSKP